MDADRYRVGLIGGRIEDEPPRTRQASPLWLILARAVPQLVIRGTTDDLVPVSPVLMDVAALRHYGAPVEYQQYADEGYAVDTGLFMENLGPHVLRGQMTSFFRGPLME